MSVYANIHNHSEYSFKDGLSRVKEIVERTKELGYPSVALTDHGNMSGAGEFYRECKKEGIKPLIGCEWYIVKDATKKDDPGRQHLLMVAKNYEGYKTMVQLTRYASDPLHFYDRPRIDRKILKELPMENVIVSTACASGDLSQLIQTEATPFDSNFKYETPDEFLDWCLNTFPNFYVEVMYHNILPKPMKKRPDLMEIGDLEIAKRTIKIARRRNLPLLITNDSHWIKESDVDFHRMMKAAAYGNVMTADSGYDGEGYWYKSREELESFFLDAGISEDVIKEGLDNTNVFSDACDISIEYLENKHWFLPKIEPDMTPRSEHAMLIEEVVNKQHRIKCSPEQWPVYKERIKQELDLIYSAGFSGYILIVADYIRKAKAEGILVGPGRGSVCGSLVAYIIGITEVDPMRHDLLFERFIDAARVKDSIPDIDIDFEDRRRQEVVDYILGKYGVENTASICNFAANKLKQTFKNIAKAYGETPAQIEKWSKHIQADYLSEDQKEELPDSIRDEVQSRCVGFERYLWKLNGLKDHIGAHAAGVVITIDGILSEVVPMAYQASTQRLLTGFDMNELKEWGIIKFDVLGLRTLSTISAAVDLIEKKRPGFRDEWGGVCESLYDRDTYEMVSSGDVVGVFQMKGTATTQACQRIQPSNFEELVSVNALCRPGAAKVMQSYIENKAHPENIDWYDSDLWKKVTYNTYGLLIYQEQGMALARDMAKMSSKDLSVLTKGMKHTDLNLARECFNQIRDSWFKGCEENNIPQHVALRVWNVLVDTYVEYSFNKSHAVAYSMLSFQTAYLKRHFPGEFLAACLMTDPADTPRYIEEAKSKNIKIEPPDINRSDVGFSFHDGSIFYGLSNIKGLGEKAASAIMSARPFANSEDWTKWQSENRSKVNKAHVEGLRECGALLSLGISPTEEDRCEREKKWLGVVVGDPIDKWFEEARAVWNDPLNDAAWKQVLNEKVKRVVEMAGVITEVTPHIDSRGRQMGFITIEYDGVKYRGTIFASNWDSLGKYVKVGAVVWARGELSWYQGKLSFSVNILKPADLHWVGGDSAKRQSERLDTGTRFDEQFSFQTMVQV